MGKRATSRGGQVRITLAVEVTVDVGKLGALHHHRLDAWGIVELIADAAVGGGGR